MTAFTINDAVNRLRIVMSRVASHNVLKIAASNINVMRRYALRRSDGRKDFECSKYDNVQNIRHVTKESADAVMAAVRIPFGD